MVKDSSGNTTQTEFSQPMRECDLVMKGGITSGIVYPPVVLKLAGEGKYRFRNVGGTSAGAIAAALAAAAEYGRETGGFERLRIMSAQLRQSGFLFQLFQPSRELKPLMYVLLDLLGKNPDASGSGSTAANSAPAASAPRSKPKRSSLWQTAQNLIATFRKYNPRAANRGSQQGLLIGLGVALLLAAIPALIFWLVAEATGTSFSLWGFVILFGLFGAGLGWLGSQMGTLAGGTIDLSDALLHKLPRNLFGICTGRADARDDRRGDRRSDSEGTPEVLTDWLSENLNDLAGMPKQGRPLTFGDLRHKPLPQGRVGEINIDLRMVTSNLSHNQPYNLPFAEQHLFLFNEDEFNLLFPPNVVNHLVKYAGKRSGYQLSPQSRFHFLPDPDDLPAVVGMRMSLSFPLLISAVPLYTIRGSAVTADGGIQQLREQDLQQNWFSDGGISSNFPIHFFDSWLPTRPTFGINLASVSPEALQTGQASRGSDPAKSLNPDFVSMAPIAPEQMSQLEAQLNNPLNSPLQNSAASGNQDVFLPEAEATPATEWIDIKRDLFTFIRQIFGTAQNYRDTLQSNLPGYRERIVQVRLTDGEGGLNLTMSDETIAGVMRKGEAAGLLLNNFNLDNHKWIRLRVLLGLLEDKLTQMERNALATGKFDYKKLIAHQAQFSYPYQTEAQSEKAEQCVDRIRDSVNKFWDAPDSASLSEDSPLPRPELRVMPEL